MTAGEIELFDALGNFVNSVTTTTADTGTSTPTAAGRLELRDPGRLEQARAWAASDESAKSS